MSAPILRRGDLVHLSIPAGPTMADSEKVGDYLCAIYRRQGIGVVAVDYVRGGKETRIVAVFRGGTE